MKRKEIKGWSEKYKAWKNAIYEHKFQIAVSFIFGILAVMLNYLSGRFTDEVGSASPPDLLLDILPEIDLSVLYIGLFPIVLGVFVFYTLIFKPEKLHYIIGMLGIYGVVKAGFSILTHLKVPGGALEITWTPFFYNWLYFSNYLFFAGNVGLAYLGYLVYRENRFLRYFMLISSFLFAASALLMHRHYSIDVLSAYFITYGIYKAGNFIFRER